jgi:hypothetical protein
MDMRHDKKVVGKWRCVFVRHFTLLIKSEVSEIALQLNETFG